MKPTGPTNEVTKKLIDDLMQRGHTEQIKFLVNLADIIGISSRRKIAVNISKLSRLCKDGETVVIPGKLLSYGEINKKITVSCLTCSDAAKNKLKKSGSKVITINELVEKNPTGKNVRLIK